MSASVNATHGNHRFVFLRIPKLHGFSQSRKSMVPMQFEGFGKWDSSHFCCFPSIFCQEPRTKLKFLARAASASSFPPISGSGDEYSDQILGAKTNQKTHRIAGVDQEEIEDPTLIADSDSCFCEFNGVQLHYKICDAELPAPDTLEDASSLQSSNLTTKISVPMILLHGFGASLFSWNRVMKTLAQVSGSKVLAFDRPAFGLTSRVNASKNSSLGKEDTSPLNPYSMMFSVLATLHFINFLAAEKAILVGHSAGSLVAVDTYFEAPERVAALILVAPAIIAPFFKQNDAKENHVGRENRIGGNSSNSNIPMNLFLRLCCNLSNFTKYIAKAIVHVAKVMGDMINSMYKKALAAILRSTFGVMAIRMIIDKFGIPAIRAAWYDSNQVSDHVLRGYTKPLTVKGWDKALVEYTVAMLTDTASELKEPQAKRLSQISCPVLIITGDTDRLVPSWNSKRLSRAIPGSFLEIIKNCGHLPQEEKAEEFVSIVDKFLRRVFGAAEEHRLKAVT